MTPDRIPRPPWSTLPGRLRYTHSPSQTLIPFVRKWRNWQTRKPQELVAARQ